jgi:hypothetical protein
MSEPQVKRWWRADKGQDVLTAISAEISRCETSQLDQYERYYELALLYDPRDPVGRAFYSHIDESWEKTENVVQSNVDTVTSVAARQTIRPVFLTDEGDWKTKRRAADLARYSEGMAKAQRLDEVKPRAFKDGAIFGYGLRRFEIDQHGTITHERFPPVEVRVPEDECLTQAPRQLHLLKLRDREELMARYPDLADKIEAERTDNTGSFLCLVSTNATDQLLVRESWRLPVGKFGKPGYLPGRKVISTASLVLLDEPYDDDRFPIGMIRWNERSTGWAGGGLAESIEGIQHAVDKAHAAHGAQLDLHASPVTYVSVHDQTAADKIRVTRIGRIVPVVDMALRPKTEIPPVIAPESERYLERMSNLSRTNSGVSDMHAHGSMPARLETGAAVRESNDVASERFAIQEKALERWYLDCIEVMLMLCRRNFLKKLPTPDIGYSFAIIKKRIKWADVDLVDVTYWLQAAPQLSRTLAGRMDTIATWQNSGLITPEQARNLINHPDLDSAMSQIDGYFEYVDRTAELLLDGEYMAPDPRGDLMGLGLDRMKGHYWAALNGGAPEDRVENMRAWMDQAAFIIAKAQAAMAPPPMPGPAPMPAPGMAAAA